MAERMSMEHVGSVDGAPIYKRGDWYFAKHPERGWCKLLWDWKSGENLSRMLDEDMVGNKVDDVLGVDKSGDGGLDIKPL